MNPLPQADRIALAARLAAFLTGDDETWQAARRRAMAENGWFSEESIQAATQAIVTNFLDEAKLQAWAAAYPFAERPKNIGLVMAGNIPLVGFHDLLCVFISGHRAVAKPSQKDTALLRAIVQKLTEWDGRVAEAITLAEGRIAGCDAYIATGSNNTARYFESYFGKYPHIIRRNRTSVAVLTGRESEADLQLLAGDAFLYYGLGCRNVTQLCVPRGYDFVPLLRIFEEAGSSLQHHHKWKNNYDYHLALYLLNKVPYMASENLLLVENDMPFSAVAVLHHRPYDDLDALLSELRTSPDIQAIVGAGGLPFGSAQQPALTDYADGEDVMAFLASLNEATE